MGTRIVSLSVGLLALLALAKVFAEEPAPPPAGNLLTQAKWLRFEILGGRIVAASERCNQSQHEAEQTPAEGSRQKLHVAAAARGFTVHYLQEDVRARSTVDLDAKGQLTIRRQLPNTAASGNVEFVQTPGKVTLQAAGISRKLEADDLWQLMLTERSACEEHLLPLLAELALCGQLARKADEIEQALLAQAGADVHSLRQQWQDSLAKLASPNFAERQAADQTLRSGGQGVLAFLRELEPRQLSSEQRGRVQAMLRELPDGSPDSPPRVAQWLLADKRVWRALMSRGELPQRIAAAEHLGKLCRRPVAFDRDASTESHAAQLAELTRMLADN